MPALGVRRLVVISDEAASDPMQASLMRLALPAADPGLYLGMSLAVTFPFNLTLGIAFYGWLAAHLAP